MPATPESMYRGCLLQVATPLNYLPLDPPDVTYKLYIYPKPHSSPSHLCLKHNFLHILPFLSWILHSLPTYLNSGGQNGSRALSFLQSLSSS